VSKERLGRILRTYVRNVFDYHRQKIYDVLTYDYTDWSRPLQQYLRRASGDRATVHGPCTDVYGPCPRKTMLWSTLRALMSTARAR